jgi:hypothetical protein
MKMPGNERTDALAYLKASNELDPEDTVFTVNNIKSHLRTAISDAQTS